MLNNLKSNILANMIILIIAWLFSNSLIWDLIYIIKPCDFYIAYQFLASAFFTIYSIMVTKDSVLFSQFWAKHLKMKKVMDIIIHHCAVFLYSIQYFSGVIVCGFSEQEKKEAWENVKKKVESVDKMPLIGKSFLILAVLLLFWVVGISVFGMPKEISEWLSDIFETIVSFVTIPFLYCSVKEYEMEKVCK